MDLRKRRTSHKINTDIGELTIVLSEPVDSAGAQLSNWQLVQSDAHGIYIIGAQINLMGADPEDESIEARLLSHLFMPHEVARQFAKALEAQLEKSDEREDEVESASSSDK
jgi:hypothetical protein